MKTFTLLVCLILAPLAAAAEWSKDHVLLPKVKDVALREEIRTMFRLARENKRDEWLARYYYSAHPNVDRAYVEAWWEREQPILKGTVAEHVNPVW